MRTRLSIVYLQFLIILLGTSCSQTSEYASLPLVLGLDHIPLAVADLESASETFRQLGFTLKPGVTHDNGIRNQHIKLKEGTEIELITAAESRDALSAEYLRFLEAGDGPAFAGLYAPNTERLITWLEAEGKPYLLEGDLVTFPESDRLHHLFFGGRVESPTDLPEHFEHPNGALKLGRVWIAGDDLEAELELMAALGAELSEGEVHAPEPTSATIATFKGGEVVLLPGRLQLVPGRRIIGATILVRDLEAARAFLEDNLQDEPSGGWTVTENSIILPPSMVHGMWLELRQKDADCTCP